MAYDDPKKSSRSLDDIPCFPKNYILGSYPVMHSKLLDGIILAITATSVDSRGSPVPRPFPGTACSHSDKAKDGFPGINITLSLDGSLYGQAVFPVGRL
ncbi:hypothetical protein MGYG_06793 [Nannizzia gypsea CBS 118893]|uniref:Uncharacterized protein n=1 Tax=Arthroderma gypseum (strain ATCC MYA-4604 / CBS 118893) TaxID=535722 RepID=E4V179_ARTGP|nr:hypothetical protein MGYG_06793 [Nannizzia gypsea CBS 118893]EFR03794.1 hypothetical protein MGYG_06793 [Nannizzia gypsea CBS 118893]